MREKIGIELLDLYCHPEQHGDWIDLKNSEEITLKKGESRLIPLGVKIALPLANEALLLPRSSTFKKYGVLQTNSVGVIDNAYGGEWKLAVYATRDIIIPAYERIAQFRIQATMQPIEFYDTTMKEADKTRGGFGHTDGKIIKMNI